MINFFSIAINHDLNTNDSKIDFNDLTIIPATTSREFIKNNHIFFRNQLGNINCYIEDYEVIKEEDEVIFFWVLCNNPEFFNYIGFPIDFNYTTPYYYWSNSEESTILQEHKFGTIPIEKPPKNAIGSIGIKLNKVSLNNQFAISFKVRKTIWLYTIYFKPSQKEWTYKIKDKNKEWTFTELFKNEDFIVFESKDRIPFFKFPSNRLLLTWTNNQPNSFKGEQSLVLPFPNYSSSIGKKDNKEVSAVYIHI